MLNESRRGKGKERKEGVNGWKRKGKEGGSEWMEEERKELVECGWRMDW